MNRRHILADRRLLKKERKAIKSTGWQDTPTIKTTSPSTKPFSSPCKKRGGKQAKRTSPDDSIEGSTPAYPHREGKRWITVLKKQESENRIRYSKKKNIL